MKKWVCIFIAAVIFTAVVSAALFACITIKTDANAIWIDESRSWLRGFYVADDMVIIKCNIFVENQSNQAERVIMLGTFVADCKGGLLKESQLLGCAEEYPKGIVFLIPPGGAEFNVDFIGTYGGVSEKQNRLIPEIQLIPVQDAIAAVEVVQADYLRITRES